MNKEQSADDPSSGSDSCKNMLNSTISMITDVLIACIEHRCLWKHSKEQLRQRW